MCDVLMMQMIDKDAKFVIKLAEKVAGKSNS